VASRAHADRDRHVLEVFRPADARIGPYEDRPGRDPVGVGHHLAHAGAGIADRAPDAGALDHLALVLRIGAVLRTLEIGEILPTRPAAAERLATEIELEALGGEEALLQGDEIIKPHAFGGDRHRSQAVGHGDSSRNSLVGRLSSLAYAFSNAFRPSSH